MWPLSSSTTTLLRFQAFKPAVLVLVLFQGLCCCVFKNLFISDLTRPLSEQCCADVKPYERFSPVLYRRREMMWRSCRKFIIFASSNRTFTFSYTISNIQLWSLQNYNTSSLQAMNSECSLYFDINLVSCLNIHVNVSHIFWRALYTDAVWRFSNLQALAVQAATL